MTLFEYGTALCNAGRDRHGVTALFAPPAATADANAPSSAAAAAAGGGKAAAGTAPPATTLSFEPMQRMMHAEKGLLYVESVHHDAINGHHAICKQFCRNSKTCTVAINSQ